MRKLGFAKYLAAILGLVLATSAHAQFFPKREILKVPVSFEDSTGEALRSFLEENGFAVAHKIGRNWYVGQSRYSSPSLPLRNGLEEYEGCLSQECEMYWAQRNQDPPILASFFAHTYQFLWVERDGMVQFILEDHALWRGNK